MDVKLGKENPVSKKCGSKKKAYTVDRWSRYGRQVHNGEGKVEFL